jgi:hypothetical protein
MDVTARAAWLFERARKETINDIRSITAKNGAMGQLGSGATAKQAIQAFGERSAAALAQMLDEVGKRINHRGKAWTRAMTQIGAALDAHCELADATIEPALKLAGANSGDAKRSVDQKIADVANDLRAQLAAFDQGWTSPNPMKLPERHPIAYAVALIAVGGLVTKDLEILFD